MSPFLFLFFSEEKIEAIYRFFARNAAYLDNLGGTLVARSSIAREVLGIVGDAKHQAHHLITVAEAGNSSAMKAAEAVGYNINRAENLMKLPSDPKLALLEELPLHLGRHPINSEAGEYLRFVRSRLKAIDERWLANRSYTQLFEEIAQLENDLRLGLRNLTWTLTHNDPRLL